MEKYNKIYKEAFTQGLKDAYEDYLKSKRKEFKKIHDKEIKNKLYDTGYIKGYNTFFNIVKNESI